MRGSLALDESGNNNDAMLINGAELAFEGGKCDSGVSLSGILCFFSQQENFYLATLNFKSVFLVSLKLVLISNMLGLIF